MFELKVMGIDWKCSETDWCKVKKYKTLRRANQAMGDLIKYNQNFRNRKWKICADE